MSEPTAYYTPTDEPDSDDDGMRVCETLVPLQAAMQQVSDQISR